MASSLISTPPPPSTTTTPTTLTFTDRSRDSHVQKKKKKLHSKHHHHHHQNQQHSQIKWKTQAQQNLYSSKLRQALAGANLSGGKSVRETADRVLATAARGKTRWSRAILTNRLKLKFRKKNKNKRQRLMMSASSSSSSSSTPVRSRKTRFSVLGLKGRKTAPVVQRKARVLGRLVPGCGKEPLPVILEEAIDYIPALEMQVRAMTALANLFLGSSSSSSGAGGGAPAS